MSYLALRHLHIACVVLTILGFGVRCYWREYAPWRLRVRWVRVMPHVIDTTLLSSAIAMAVLSQQYPLVNDWLTAKLLGLLAYIAFGSMALKRAKGRTMRFFYTVLAGLAFAYIVGAALSRDPKSFLALFWTAASGVV